MNLNINTCLNKLLFAKINLFGKTNTKNIYVLWTFHKSKQYFILLMTLLWSYERKLSWTNVYENVFWTPKIFGYMSWLFFIQDFFNWKSAQQEKHYPWLICKDDKKVIFLVEEEDG